MFSCLNRYIPALLFGCVQEHLSVSWSGIWNYSTSRQFLGQITIWATNVEEGKNVYCTIELAHASIAKIMPEATVLGNSPREAIHLLFWVTCLYTENTCSCSERKSWIYFVWAVENLATCVDKINISMTIQIWNITFSWLLLKTISISFLILHIIFPCINIVIHFYFTCHPEVGPFSFQHWPITWFPPQQPKDSMHDFKINSLAIFFCRKLRSYSAISIVNEKGKMEPVL